MAKRSGGATFSALDKMYSKLTKARKKSRGHISWRQAKSLCDVDPKKKFPCTTTYVQTRTGRKVIVRTKRAAQFAMPRNLRSISDLRGVPGVVAPRKRSSGGRRKASKSRR